MEDDLDQDIHTGNHKATQKQFQLKCFFLSEPALYDSEIKRTKDPAHVFLRWVLFFHCGRPRSLIMYSAERK